MHRGQQRCRVCRSPLLARELQQDRSACARCYAENENVQADVVHELDLFATSDLTASRMLVAAASLIARDAIDRDFYDVDRAFKRVELVAQSLPLMYFEQHGPTDYVPSVREVPEAVIGELASGLLEDAVLGYIAEHREQLEHDFGGPLPKGLR
jgi:hypothetical protein